MSQARYVLSIDQGTTSTRCIVFDDKAQQISLARREFAQHYPDDGWVEHDPEDIWRDVVDTVREALGEAGLTDGTGVAAIGITNQRETVVLWERETGKPVYLSLIHI